MFPAAELTSKMPRFQTRRALIAIDLQEDFLSPTGVLPIDNLVDVIRNVQHVIPAFRQVGDIIWVQTEFSTDRQVNNVIGKGENIITDEELGQCKAQLRDNRSASGSNASTPLRGTSPSPNSMGGKLTRCPKHNERRGSDRDVGEEQEEEEEEEEAEEANEAFLSISAAGNEPDCCIPGTTGVELAAEIQPCVDHERDKTFIKSHYSAFKNENLLLQLRSRIVTEIYICGSLSNVTVFATVLEAVRHGLAVTLIDGCLGYRDKNRHKEAMDQMTELMYAEVVTIDELDSLILSWSPAPRKATNPKKSKGQGKANGNGNIDTLLAGMKVGDDSSNSAKLSERLTTSLTTQKDSKGSRGADRGEITRGPGIEGFKEPAPSNDSTLVEDDSTKTPDEEQMRSTLEGIPREPISKFRHNKQARGLLPEDLPSPTFQMLEAVSASLEEVASNPQSLNSQPTATVPVMSPTDVETAMAQTIRPVFSNSVSQTHIRGLSVQSLGPEDIIAEGDSRIVYDLLPEALCTEIFQRLKAEVHWQTMYHRGGEVPRLVAVEGDIDEDGSFPIYRHPADESPALLPFSPSVMKIREHVQKTLQQPVNHVLIQHYRHGQDYISEHSDKTLDIVRGSSIVNVSLGAQRTMTLRTKKPGSAQAVSNMSIADSENASVGIGSTYDPSEASSEPKLRENLSPDDANRARTTQRIPMPHNSMFILGQVSNMRWLHAVRQDKRLPSQKNDAENAFDGERISLTFRYIGTFLDKDSRKIWGQGARSKSRDNPGEVVNGDTYEAEQMIKAFGTENQRSDFEWNAEYGEGFDVLNIANATPKLFASGDSVVDSRVKMCLAEKGLTWDMKASSPSFDWKKQNMTPEEVPRVKFVDHDNERSEVEGDLAILLYLETYCLYNALLPPMDQRSAIAAVYTRTYASDILLAAWRDAYRTLQDFAPSEAAKFLLSKQIQKEREHVVSPFRRELRSWEKLASKSEHIAGDRFTLADCAFWPVLNEIIEDWIDWNQHSYPKLAAYWKKVKARDSVKVMINELSKANGAV